MKFIISPVSWSFLLEVKARWGGSWVPHTVLKAEPPLFQPLGSMKSFFQWQMVKSWELNQGTVNWWYWYWCWSDYLCFWHNLNSLTSQFSSKMPHHLIPPWSVEGLVNPKLCLRARYLFPSPISLSISGPTFPSLLNKIPRFSASLVWGRNPPRESSPVLSWCHSWQVIIFIRLLQFSCLWKHARIWICED